MILLNQTFHDENKTKEIRIIYKLDCLIEDIERQSKIAIRKKLAEIREDLRNYGFPDI